ncbi:hypothetical protein NDU88_001602 [Pleurodeles waltl]|uniref:Uncharacterized protein n=1 Tax=Pleurodeles waltl TaxID=8319 RepID=A0AAV7U8J1_PLEWA|nr:hypothetical protein NDU88_001602 [Pleurodeles waltl]
MSQCRPIPPSKPSSVSPAAPLPSPSHQLTPGSPRRPASPVAPSGDDVQSATQRPQKRAGRGALEEILVLSPPTVVRWVLLPECGRHVVSTPWLPAEHSCSAPLFAGAGPPEGSARSPYTLRLVAGWAGQDPGGAAAGSQAIGITGQITAAILVFSRPSVGRKFGPKTHSPLGSDLSKCATVPPHLQPCSGVGWGSTAYQAGPEWGSLAGASRRGFFCHRRQATPPSNMLVY